MKLNGANGRRILILVHPNTQQTLRLVLVDDVLAGQFCAWLRRTRVPHQCTTTVLPGVKKTIEEQARIYKLLMDFRRDRTTPLNQGDIQ